MQPPEPTWQQAVALWWRDVHSTVWMAARDVRLWAVEARGYWFARMLLRLIRCAYRWAELPITPSFIDEAFFGRVAAVQRQDVGPPPVEPVEVHWSEPQRIAAPDGLGPGRALEFNGKPIGQVLPTPREDRNVEAWLGRELVASGAVVPGSMDVSLAPPQSEAEKAGRVLRATMHYTPPSIDEEKLAAFAKENAGRMGVLVREPGGGIEVECSGVVRLQSGELKTIASAGAEERRRRRAAEAREEAHLERAQECYRAFREEAGKVDGPLPEWKRLNEYEQRAWVAVAKAMELDPYW